MFFGCLPHEQLAPPDRTVPVAPTPAHHAQRAVLAQRMLRHALVTADTPPLDPVAAWFAHVRHGAVWLFRPFDEPKH